MFTDFQDFQSAISWFIEKDDKVTVINGTITSNTAFAATFPILNKLMQAARVLHVSINADVYKLFAWTTSEGDSCGWLCKQEPANISAIELLPEHQLLLDTIGGIQESYHQPDGSFTNNQNFLFIKSDCEQGIAGWAEYYQDCCTEGNCSPLPVDDLVSFVHEANGAQTLYDRTSKRVYLFSHDHAFDYVTTVEGQPEYTFHTIDDVNSFIDYVEEPAKQWRRHIEGA